MMWLSEFLSPVAEGWVLTLFHSVWQGALIAGLVYLVLWVFQIRNPKIRYGAGLAGMGLFVLTISITFFNMMPASAEGEMVHVVQPTMTEVVTARIAATDAGWSVISFIRENMPFLLRAWAVGALLLLFRMAGGYQYMRRIIRRGEDTTPESWKLMIRNIADRMQIRRKIRVLHSAHTDMPMVFGHIKPVLLLPVGLLSGMSTDQLEAIFAHELAHIRRHDYLVNIGQQVLEALFFFNPFVWVLSGLLRTEREKCCDDLAMEICHNEREYVEALSTLELYRSALPTGAMTLLGKKGELLARIRRLTDPAYGETGSSKWVIMIALSFTFFLVSYFVQSSEGKEMAEEEVTAESAVTVMPAYFNVQTDTIPEAEPVDPPKSSSHVTAVRVQGDSVIKQGKGSYRFYTTSPDSNVRVYVRSGEQDTLIYGVDGMDNFTFVMPDAPDFPDVDFEVPTWVENNARGFSYVFRSDTLPRLNINDSLLSEEDREAIQRAREEMQRARELMQEERERMREIMEKYREEYPEAMEEYRRAMQEMEREMNNQKFEVIIKDRPEVVELERVLRDQARLSEEQIREVEVQLRKAEGYARKEMLETQKKLRATGYPRGIVTTTVRPYMDRDKMDSFQQQVEEMLRVDDYLDNDDELKKIELTEDYFKYNGKKVKGGDFHRYLRAYESRFGKLDGTISMKLD